MIAIHHRPGSFSDKWIEYCKENNVVYKIVNCFNSDIIAQLQDCNGLMWHWPHWDLKAQLFARQLTYSLEEKGINVFPNSKTSWHYDDKVGQKYLLEAINAPLVPTFVFYNKQEALDWASTTTFPKVFKTRNGAGSQNVKLIKSKREAYNIIQKAFGKGIPSYDKMAIFRDSIWKLKRDKSFKAVGRVVKYTGMLALPSSMHHDFTLEKDYAYFQEFIPENDSDIRVIAIGNRAFAIKRMIRINDFRASGSGNFLYDRNMIPEETVKKTFDLNKKHNTQSCAVDWVFNKKLKEYQLIEISYAFSSKAYYGCPGYWDSELTWHEEKVIPEYFMIEDFLNELKISQK